MVSEHYPLVHSDVPTIYSKEEAQDLLKVSMSTLDKLLRRRQLRHIKIGRRVLIPADAIIEMLKAGEK